MANGTIVDRNNVQGIINLCSNTFGANGIELNAGNNTIVRNNFVSNVTHDMSGGAAFSTGFGVFGMIVTAGTGHQVYNNSVNMYGLYPGAPNTQPSFSCVRRSHHCIDRNGCPQQYLCEQHHRRDDIGIANVVDLPAVGRHRGDESDE